ncbi:MAG: gamma-glutamyltransferase family protein [Propionibacteriales bacterium]|nr:gamma-glutamyltransferase family protein [Propionibacteriales bacterium]
MTFTTRPTLEGTYGMVSSTHWLASQSAMAVLERGGNAFDAAVAAGFVLHVVEPHLNGPGGEVPAIVATSGDPTPRVLMGQGPAPEGATLEHFRSLGLDMVPGAGLLSAAVPGAVDAWLLLLRDSGTMRLDEVLDYAIGYARGGHPVVDRVGTTVETVSELFEEHWPTSAALWMPGGRIPVAGQVMQNPAYADVLESLAEYGRTGSRVSGIERAREAWREGFVAAAVDRFVQTPYRDSSGGDHAGVLTGQDMAAFRATWEPAVTAPFRDVEVVKTGPWGQGPVLLQMLRMLDGYDDAQLDPSTPDGVHLIAEVMKLAFADREAWYGDSADVPIDDLLSSSYAADRRALIGDTASTELRPGSPGGRPPRLPVLPDVPTRAEAAVGAGEPTVSRSGVHRGDTCHVDVVDRHGNFISATPSGGWLHSSPVIPELGFPLGTRLQMLWLQDGLASSVRPGRRPRTTLSPTLVLREGTPVLACGTPGGDQQDQWQLLFLLRHLVGGADLQTAIDAPAWHTTSLPESFWPRGMAPGGLVVEDRFDEALVPLLERRGHVVTRSEPWSLGRLCAVARDVSTGVLSAGANPRGMQGYACGR